ncbi:MAG TPA: hypothetical protein VHX68_11495 [Planctomycetaceae bacterium]|nr:hypothetical protein [Planctomycetaceae bacterium]
MSSETIKPARKGRRWLFAVSCIVVPPMIYMGAYYATCAHYCREQDGHYMVGDAQLPYCFEILFAPADWAEQ